MCEVEEGMTINVQHKHVNFQDPEMMKYGSANIIMQNISSK
jgi:hypothetical protein